MFQDAFSDISSHCSSSTFFSGTDTQESHYLAKAATTHDRSHDRSENLTNLTTTYIIPPPTSYDTSSPTYKNTATTYDTTGSPYDHHAIAQSITDLSPQHNGIKHLPIKSEPVSLLHTALLGRGGDGEDAGGVEDDMTAEQLHVLSVGRRDEISGSPAFLHGTGI